MEPLAGRRFLKKATAVSKDHLPPDVPEPLLLWLEAAYPPRCRLRNEGEREHERYAGKVDLVQDLRAAYEARFDDYGAGDDEDEGEGDPKAATKTTSVTV